MLSDTVGDRVSTWRKRRGWNRERLAEECTRVRGSELTASSLTNIESGRRKDGVRRRMVTVDELVILAQALRVPPALLLSPYPDAGNIEYLPELFSDGSLFINWLRGMDFLWAGLQGSEEQERAADYSKSSQSLRMLYEHNDIIQTRATIGSRLVEITNAPKAGDEDESARTEARMKEFLRTLDRFDHDIVELRQSMAKEDIALPTLPPFLSYLEVTSNADYRSRNILDDERIESMIIRETNNWRGMRELVDRA